MFMDVEPPHYASQIQPMRVPCCLGKLVYSQLWVLWCSDFLSFFDIWSSSLLTQLGLSPNLDFPSHSSKHSFPCWYPHFFLLPFLPTRMPLECHNTQVLNKSNLNSLHYPFLVNFPGALRASSCRTKLGGCHHDGDVGLGSKQIWPGLEACQIWGCGGWVICLFVWQLVSPVFWPSLKFLKFKWLQYAESRHCFPCLFDDLPG